MNGISKMNGRLECKHRESVAACLGAIEVSYTSQTNTAIIIMNSTLGSIDCFFDRIC